MGYARAGRFEGDERFEEFCKRVENLRVDRSGGIAKPYKPILVATVVLLIHKGKITTSQVMLDGGLRDAFGRMLGALFPDWPIRPVKIEYPFRHLANDGVWRLEAWDDTRAAFMDALESRAEAWEVLKHVRCARLDERVFHRLATRFEDRFRVLSILVQRYFPTGTSGILWQWLNAGEPDSNPAIACTVRDRGSERLLEKALEENLERNWMETQFAVRDGVVLARREEHGLPGRQVFTPVNCIDLLGHRERPPVWWVFELSEGAQPTRSWGRCAAISPG